MIAKLETGAGLKIGDIVEVRRIVAFRGDEWTPARVTAIRPTGFFPAFDVEAVAGAFDNLGHDRMALQFCEKGRGWR